MGERFDFPPGNKVTGSSIRFDVEGKLAILTVTFEKSDSLSVRFTPHAEGLYMAMDELGAMLKDAVENGSYEIVNPYEEDLPGEKEDPTV